MPDAFSWSNGFQAAVSLTFDDGLPCHPAGVAPLLESFGLRATFYPPILSDLRLHPITWRALARKGHELGNHTLFHPCRGEPEIPRPWLEAGYNLIGYSARRWCDEVDAANFALNLLDGESERTFGNTCFENTIGSAESLINLEPLIAQRFVAARGEHTRQAVLPSQANLFNLGTYDIDGFTADQVIELIEIAFQFNQWVIFTAHGVGAGTHRLFIETEELGRVAAYLAQHRESIWTAPLIEVARTIRNQRGEAA